MICAANNGDMLSKGAAAGRHTDHCVPTTRQSNSRRGPYPGSRPLNLDRLLARSHKAGVTIAFGTDMGVGPHGQNAREFGFMVEAGMHSREAIKAATVNAAKLLDVSDEVGTIASGKSADVIAVDSSPLDDVSVLQRMAFVMARGDIYLGVTA